MVFYYCGVIFGPSLSYSLFCNKNFHYRKQLAFIFNTHLNERHFFLDLLILSDFPILLGHLWPKYVLKGQALKEAKHVVHIF